MDGGLRSQDAFRPPPGLVSLATAVSEGVAPFEVEATAASSGVVADHMKVRSSLPGPSGPLLELSNIRSRPSLRRYNSSCEHSKFVDITSPISTPSK